MEIIGSKRSYALTWCMPNNDDDDDVYLDVSWFDYKDLSLKYIDWLLNPASI